MEFDHEGIDGRKATPNRARVWTIEEIQRLIKVWSRHEVLYNTRHPDYYKRERRSVAMADLQEELGGVSLVDIIRKMENLRSYFGREIKRLYDNGIPVGSLEGQSRWAYFDSLLFLEEHMNQKRANARSDDGIERFDSHGGEHIEASLGEEHETVYQVEPEEIHRQTKRPKLNERSKQDLTKSTLTKSMQSNHLNLESRSGLVAPVKATVRDSYESYLIPREQSRVIPGDRIFSDTHEDMVFAEHVGRTIMSITDELLKEDLKLQIQQCLCASKRKQIALHQQQHSLRSNSNCNNTETWQRADKNDTHPPSFVSFVSIGSPDTPVHPVPAQVESEEQSKG